MDEESAELIIEAFAKDKKRMTQEAADLLYHILVLLRESGIQLDDVIQVLKKWHRE